MSQLFVDDVVNKEGTGSVGFSKGINVSASSTITGNLNVSGVLTYEDVTNIDAVGVVTARSGIKIGAAGIGGTIAANGNTTLAGVVTATSFSGDGSALTGMANTANVNTADLRVVGVATIGVGLTLADDVEARFGNAGDLKIYHDGSSNIIDAATSNTISFRRGGSEQFFVGNAEFKGGDDKKIKLGTGDDLQIYHDASNSYIVDAGELRIKGTHIKLRGTNDEDGLIFTQNGSIQLKFNDNLKLETTGYGATISGGACVSGVTTAFGDVNVGSAVTVYASAGIVSATAYYGDGSNLSGAGGMWTLMASADTTGQSGNDYDIFTDFASHTDKKWWKLVFNMVADSNDFSGMGLRIKVGGAWKTSDYKWQQGYFSGTGEVGSNQDSQSRYSLTTGDEKWHRGEVTFFNPHATSEYHLFEYTGFAADHSWNNQSDQPWVERSAGGWVGGTGAIQALRWNQYGSTWGDVNFALFAGNGW